MVVHELFFKNTGEIMCYPVKEAVASYSESISLDIKNGWGKGILSVDDNTITLDSKDGFSVAKIATTESEELYISFDIEVKDNTCAGLLFRADIGFSSIMLKNGLRINILMSKGHLIF